MVTAYGRFLSTIGQAAPNISGSLASATCVDVPVTHNSLGARSSQGSRSLETDRLQRTGPLPASESQEARSSQGSRSLETDRLQGTVPLPASESQGVANRRYAKSVLARFADFFRFRTATACDRSLGRPRPGSGGNAQTRAPGPSLDFRRRSPEARGENYCARLTPGRWPPLPLLRVLLSVCRLSIYRYNDPHQ